jgi:hypothetical protein
MVANAQRRKFERFPIDCEVEVEIHGRHLHGRLTDVSQGGAFVKLEIEVAVGDDVLLALEDAQKVAAGASVRRVTGDGFAIRFDEETVGRIMAEAARNGDPHG